MPNRDGQGWHAARPNKTRRTHTLRSLNALAGPIRVDMNGAQH